MIITRKNKTIRYSFIFSCDLYLRCFGKRVPARQNPDIV